MITQPSLSQSDRVVRAGIVLLVVTTAATHLTLNFPDLVFILNGLGYLALLAALYLPLPMLSPLQDRRHLVCWLLLGYTLLTIVLWLLIGERTALGAFNKATEVLLIALLLREARRLQAVCK